MTLDKMTLDKMTLDKMTLDKMTLDKMTLYILPHSRMTAKQRISKNDIQGKDTK